MSVNAKILANLPEVHQTSRSLYRSKSVNFSILNDNLVRKANHLSLNEVQYGSSLVRNRSSFKGHRRSSSDLKVGGHHRSISGKMYSNVDLVRSEQLRESGKEILNNRVPTEGYDYITEAAKCLSEYLLEETKNYLTLYKQNGGNVLNPKYILLNAYLKMAHGDIKSAMTDIKMVKNNPEFHSESIYNFLSSINRIMN